LGFNAVNRLQPANDEVPRRIGGWFAAESMPKERRLPSWVIEVIG
jgi:hypothetical protein